MGSYVQESHRLSFVLLIEYIVDSCLCLFISQLVSSGIKHVMMDLYLQGKCCQHYRPSHLKITGRPKMACAALSRGAIDGHVR